ncbi:MAG: hypothetical protein EBU90_21470 [Proteobacteria bacterium]|nr:hypothetical protein [Pseudomonadota bacterium]NBP15055.1 hypothetical protein [bacterium]
MANVNLKSLTSVFGKAATQALTTSSTAIVSNGSNSNKLLKISSLLVSNVGSSAATYTLDFYRSSTATRIVKDLSVSLGATSVAVSVDAPIYLEEGDSLRLTASSNSTLEAVCSYEDIS